MKTCKPRFCMGPVAWSSCTIYGACPSVSVKRWVISCIAAVVGRWWILWLKVGHELYCNGGGLVVNWWGKGGSRVVL